MKFRTQYSETDPNEFGVAIDPAEKVTRDSFKDETDINKIMAKYVRTGELPATNLGDPLYADVSNLPADYLEAVSLVERAESDFMALPASVRAECDNDPAQFLTRIGDPAWARKHGLTKDEPEAPKPPSEAPQAPPGTVKEASNPPAT